METNQYWAMYDHRRPHLYYQQQHQQYQQYQQHHQQQYQNNSYYPITEYDNMLCHQLEKNSINDHQVYAFHDFMASVDGQVTVMKDDALTLLDDTNAYWWLVKVLKTSEIGYIPAEIIETPLERLAKINKYRNAKIILNPSLYNENSPNNKKKSSKKNRNVMISDNISIQTMTITTDINDIPIMATYDEYQDVMLGPKNNNQPLLNFDHSQYGDDINDDKDKVEETNSIPMHHELQPCSTISNQYKSPPPPPPHSIREKTNNLRKFLSNQKSNILIKNNINLSSSSSLGKNDNIKEEEEEEEEEEQLSILRIFAGNINVNATFNSVLVNEQTTADQLLKYALERFRIENQQSIGIEYYITVKVMNKDEIILSPQDKPLAIFHSLTAHLTTPMPSLTHDQSKVQLNCLGVSPINVPEASFGQDSVIRFYLHKRIKRMNEQSGQLLIKIAYYTPVVQQQQSKLSQLVQFSKRKSFNLKQYHSTGKLSTLSSSIQPMERIEKLVNVSSKMKITDLTTYALEKFHIQHGVPYTLENENMDKYGMTLVINGKENVLNGKKKIIDIFNDEWLMPKGAENPLFVLRKMQSRISTSQSRPNMKQQHSDNNNNTRMYNVRNSNSYQHHSSPNTLPLVSATKPNSTTITNNHNNNHKLILTSGVYNPSDTSLPSSILSSASSTTSSSSSSASSFISLTSSSSSSPYSTPISNPSTVEKISPDAVLNRIDVTLSAFEKDLSFNNLSVYHASLCSTYDK